MAAQRLSTEPLSRHLGFSSDPANVPTYRHPIKGPEYIVTLTHNYQPYHTRITEIYSFISSTATSISTTKSLKNVL